MIVVAFNKLLRSCAEGAAPSTAAGATQGGCKSPGALAVPQGHAASGFVEQMLARYGKGDRSLEEADRLRRRGKKLLFGYRRGSGMEVCSISYQKLHELGEMLSRGALFPINERHINLAEALRAYQDDGLSAPLLFMTSSEMLASDVLVDEGDEDYVADLMGALALSVQMFGANIEQSDKRKRELQALLSPAGVVEGVIGDGDEICKRGARRRPQTMDLCGERLISQVRAYNSKMRAYREIARALGGEETQRCIAPDGDGDGGASGGDNGNDVPVEPGFGRGSDTDI